MRSVTDGEGDEATFACNAKGELEAATPPGGQAERIGTVRSRRNRTDGPLRASMNYFREYFSTRVYCRNFGQAIVIMACGLALAFLSSVFGGAIVMWVGVLVTFVGMALVPSMGYRDSKDEAKGKQRSSESSNGKS